MMKMMDDPLGIGARDSYITYGTSSCVCKWKLEAFSQIALTTETPGKAKDPLPISLTPPPNP